MTEREKERLLTYILNEMIRLENDVIDRRNAVVRYENCVVYYYELATVLIRQKSFRKFSQDVLEILGLRSWDVPEDDS